MPSRRKPPPDSGCMFRPQPLLAPTLSTTPVDYSVYLKSYQDYTNALLGFKEQFWARVNNADKAVHVSMEPAVVVATVDKKNGHTVAKILHSVEGADAVVPQPDKRYVETPAIVSKLSTVDRPAPVKVAVERKAANPERARQKRQRYRRNKRAALLLAALNKANLMKSLEVANEGLALAAKHQNESEWTVVTRRGKLVHRHRKKRNVPLAEVPKTAAKLVKGKGPSSRKPPKGGGSHPKGGGGPPKPPSGPPGGDTRADDSKQDPSSLKKEEKAPNRKERRRAIHGPPAGQQVVLQVVEPIVIEKPMYRRRKSTPDPQDYSPGGSYAPATIWPPPEKSWIAEAPLRLFVGEPRASASITASARTEKAGALANAKFDRSIGLEPYRKPAPNKGAVKRP